MDKGILTRILQAYGVSGRIIGEPQKGYRNSSHLVETSVAQLNLILYKSEPGILQRIHSANEVGTAVAASGLPARRPEDVRILVIKAGDRTKYAALYNYLPGKTIPWEAYTMEHLKQLGATMAHMHQNLKRYNVAKLPEVALENATINKRMIRYFNDENVANAARIKLGVQVLRTNFTTALSAYNKLPQQQALHMDFVRGNVLFEDTTITGIIDFEKTAYGSPLFDVARTLAFLLVDCKYKPEDKIRKYFLSSGYIKRGGVKLTDYTINGESVLEQLINFFLLHDFYKFLRHNPYESLAQNDHYTRTRALLLKRRLISEV